MLTSFCEVILCAYDNIVHYHNGKGTVNGIPFTLRYERTPNDGEDRIDHEWVIRISGRIPQGFNTEGEALEYAANVTL